MTVYAKCTKLNQIFRPAVLYKSDEKRSRNPPNVLTGLFLNVEDIFMEKNANKNFPGFVSITSTVHREVEQVTKIGKKFFKA